MRYTGYYYVVDTFVVIFERTRTPLRLTHYSPWPTSSCLTDQAINRSSACPHHCWQPWRETRFKHSVTLFTFTLGLQNVVQKSQTVLFLSIASIHDLVGDWVSGQQIWVCIKEAVHCGPTRRPPQGRRGSDKCATCLCPLQNNSTLYFPCNDTNRNLPWLRCRH